MLITRVLELNEEESRELFFAAFPYFPLWMTAIHDNLNLDKTYELMDEHGYSTLTKPYPPTGILLQNKVPENYFSDLHACKDLSAYVCYHRLSQGAHDYLGCYRPVAVLLI